MLSFTAVLFSFWNTVSYRTWNSVTGRLAGQQAPGIFLPLLPQSLDYTYVGLVTQTWALVLVCEALYCLSYLSGV